MKLSLIIPSFNQAYFLKETLGSVLGQRGDFALEVIVMDGGSTDGTIELLKAIDDPRLTWVSEPDNGQSHAINKGFGRARGDLVAWLNSDDLYLPGALATVADVFAQQPEARWLVGRCEIMDAQGRVIRRSITRYKDRALRRYRYRKLLRENFISQMGVFWRRSFAEEVGLLDESLMYTMDYDYWLRMGVRHDPVILDRVLARFRWHDRSKSGKVNRAQFDEQYAVACRYFQGDRVSQAIHRFNVEKIVWSYRLLRLLGR